MAKLFERKVRLVLGGSLIENLRVSFKVRRTLKKEPNTCEISVWNLSEQSRAALQHQKQPVILEAGFTTTLARLYSGDSRYVDQAHDGPEWVTKIQCGDGERAYQYRRINLAFAKGARVVDVVSRVAEALGFPDTGLDKLSGVTERFMKGYTASGRVADELDHLLKSRGFEWSIQDGQLQILPAGQPTAQEAVSLSADTGMIGSPEHGNPEKKVPVAQILGAEGEGFHASATKVTGPAVLKVKSLIQPGFVPGRKVQVKAAGIQGFFRIQSVEHDGDSFGGNWYSSLECLPTH